MSVSYIGTPCGRLGIKSDGKYIKKIYLTDDTEGTPDALSEKAARELCEYFDGKRTVFSVPLSPDGTDFCKKVWAALRTIPYGETRTYGELAGQIGMPRAARAVGGAVGRNPVLIMLPCHRVVSASGIGGFSCGLDVKKVLMKTENINIKRR